MKKSYCAGFVLAAFTILLACSGCKKTVPDGVLPTGQIALTFDDNNVDNWHSYLPLLDSLQIRATFYVSKYHHLSPVQKQELRDIAAHGHEIAFHTTNHPDMVKLLGHKSLSAVMYEEVHKDLDSMNRDGFSPQNFAYPYASRTPELDAALLRVFRTVRAASNKQDWARCLAGHCGNGQILYGADVDERSGMDDAALVNILSLAKDHHDCAVLTAHDINKPQHAYQITLRRLRYIAKQASRLQLQFVTVSQIGR